MNLSVQKTRTVSNYSDGKTACPTEFVYSKGEILYEIFISQKYMMKKEEKMAEQSKLLLLLLFFFSYPLKKANYGVFLGISMTPDTAEEGLSSDDKETEQLLFLAKYKTVVLSPGSFQKKDLQYLHRSGTKAYAYINVGALEKYDSEYLRFKKLSLAPYENWEDESWVDVSDKDWQDYITENIAKEIAGLGFDGFFLDNFDVYYLFPEEKIYQGLESVLQGLQKYKMPIMLNGGDAFVSRAIGENSASLLFQGVNQEDVFTSYHFDTDTSSVQDSETRKYYQDYLEKAKNAGLSVYILEYMADDKLAHEISAYCKKNHFQWYNAPGIFLTEGKV